MPLVSHPPLHHKTSDSPKNTNTDDNQLYIVFTNKKYEKGWISLKEFTQALLVKYIQTHCTCEFWAVWFLADLCSSEHHNAISRCSPEWQTITRKHWCIPSSGNIYSRWECLSLEETERAWQVSCAIYKLKCCLHSKINSINTHYKHLRPVFIALGNWLLQPKTDTFSSFWKCPCSVYALWHIIAWTLCAFPNNCKRLILKKCFICESWLTEKLMDAELK